MPPPADEPVEALRALSAPLVDDRDMVGPQDRVLLVVDNDHAFSGVMADLAHDHGYKVLTTAFGAAALALARERQPDAITLDISLPDFDGWRVLDRLKHDLDTRHIPVFVITTDEERERSFSLGAAGVLNKPVQTREQLEVVFQTLARVTRPEPQRALVLARGAGGRRHSAGSSATRPSRSTPSTRGIRREATAGRARRATAWWSTPPTPSAPSPRCRRSPRRPWRCTRRRGCRRKLTRDLRRQTLVAAGARVADRSSALFDDVALLLHLQTAPVAGPARARRWTGATAATPMLAGRKVLIVDDDIRNIFAMTSVLETHQMQVVAAENGKDGIEKLQATPGIDIVLMDIMMPDMDGYDTMRAIRGIPEFRSLPIVAVTAKAMKGDREKCIEAGAWDYLPKPVASDQLLSVFRTWLAPVGTGMDTISILVVDDTQQNPSQVRRSTRKPNPPSSRTPTTTAGIRFSGWVTHAHATTAGTATTAAATESHRVTDRLSRRGTATRSVPGKGHRLGAHLRDRLGHPLARRVGGERLGRQRLRTGLDAPRPLGAGQHGERGGSVSRGRRTITSARTKAAPRRSSSCVGRHRVALLARRR